MIFWYSRATWLFSSENDTKWDYALFFPDNDERLEYSSWTSSFYNLTTPFAWGTLPWSASTDVLRRVFTPKSRPHPFSFTQFSLWQTGLCALFSTLATAEEPLLWRYSLHFLHLPYFEISINPIFLLFNFSMLKFRFPLRRKMRFCWNSRRLLWILLIGKFRMASGRSTLASSLTLLVIIIFDSYFTPIFFFSSLLKHVDLDFQILDWKNLRDSKS